MFNRYLYIFLVFAVAAPLVFTQNIKKTGGFARLGGLGANPYVIDPFNETVNPAWGSVYDNFLFGDIGSSAGPAFSSGGFGQFVSANFSLGNNFTLGGILTRNDFNGLSIALLDPFSRLGLGPGGGGVVGFVNSVVGAGSVTPLDNNLQLMATISFGRTAVGFAVAYATTTTETPVGTTGKNEGTASQIGINAGLLTDLTSSIKLDVGASFIFPSAEFKPATGETTDASQTIIAVNGRLFWKHSSKLWFVPVISFATVSGSANIGTTTPSTSTDLTSYTTINVGFGINYTIGDFLLAGGPSFTTASITSPAGVNNTPPELTTSILAFPVWNLGVEWNLLDWLVGRLGYVAATAKVTTESTTGTPPTVVESIATVFLPSQTGVTVGVGFRFGDFSLDAVVNEDVLRQGFNNIGGGGPTFAYLSASYAMP